MRTRTSLILCGLAVLALAAVQPAHAGLIYWDEGGANQSWNTAANWSDNATPTSGNEYVLDDSLFTMIASYGLDNSFTIQTLTLNAAAMTDLNANTPGDTTARVLTLNGGTATPLIAVGSLAPASVNIGVAAGVGTLSITLAASGDIQVATGKTLTIMSAIGQSGTQSLTKTGTGTLTLSGANTYSGGTILNGGTLQIDADARLGDVNGGITVNSDSTLFVTLATTFAATRTVTLNNGAVLTIADNNKIDKVAGKVTGTGGVYLTGGSQVWFTNTANDFTGPITIGDIANRTWAYFTSLVDSPASAPTLITFGASGVGATGPVLLYNGTADVTFNNRSLYLSGTSSNNPGGAIQNDGTGKMVFNGAFTSVAGLARTLTLMGSNAGANEISSIISDSAAADKVSVTKAGAGTWILSNANTYTGATTVSAGTLNITGTLASATVAITGGTLRLQNAGAIASSALTATGGTLDLRSNTPATFTAASIAISNGTINVANNGSGTGNTLSLGAVTTSGTAAYTANFTGANGYLLNLASFALIGGTGNNTTLNPTSTSLTILGNVTNPMSGFLAANFDTLTLGGTSTGNSVNGVISDAPTGSLTLGGYTKVAKTGTGTWTLAGANTYTGSTIINAGTLRVDAGAGGSLTGNLTLGTSTAPYGAGTFIYDNTNATGAKALTLGALTAPISNPGDNAVQVTRTAAQDVSLTFTTVSTANTENGNIINFVVGGTSGTTNGTNAKIILADQTTYNIVKQNAYFNGGDFAVYDTTAGTGLLGFVRGIKYGTDAGSATSAGVAFTATLNQEMTTSITGQPTKTLGVSGTSSGTLKIVGASDLALASNAVLTIAGKGNNGAMGILKTGGGTSTISGSGTASLSLSNTQEDIRTDGATDVLNITIPIVLGDATRFLKSGAGTLTLNSSITQTTARPTFINGGTLEIGGSGAITGAMAGNSFRIANGATFKYNSSAAQALTGVISGAGAVTVAGSSGTLTLSGANTFTGQLTVEAGKLAVATVNNVSAAGTLGNSALSVILGKTGSSTGTLQYTGATAGSTKPFNLATGGTGAFQVDTAGTVLTLSGLIDGGGGLAKTGLGTLTLSGAKTYTGTTSITDGTLALGATGSIVSTLINVGSGATFDVSAVTGGYTLAGGKTLKGFGTVAGAMVVAGVLSPGDSPGTLTVKDAVETWAGGGTYAWQLLDATGTMPGIEWDFAAVTGTGNLNVTATSGSKFNIVLQTLESTGPDVQGMPSNWNAGLAQSWMIASSANAITGWDVADGAASDLFAINTANFVGAGAGTSFNVSKTGNDVYLNYVPEPATIALLGIGALGMVMHRRLRKA